MTATMERVSLTERLFGMRLEELKLCVSDYQHRSERYQFDRGQVSWELAERLAEELSGVAVRLDAQVTRRECACISDFGAQRCTEIHESKFKFSNRHTSIELRLVDDEPLAPQFVLGICHLDESFGDLLFFNPLDPCTKMVFAG